MQILAQSGPAGTALAIDLLRHGVREEREEGPGLGLSELADPDPLINRGGGWQFEYPAHIELIETEIVEAISRATVEQRDEIEILLIEVPPRHGKSTLISENAPAWFLGTFPNRRLILCSCDADFAGTWGMKSRDLLEEHGRELFGVEVSQKSKAKKRWDLEGTKGGMITAGIGGRITGSGAHLMVIDDPVKNAEEAMSDVIREKHREWWLSTARTRLEPGAVVVVLMTRWHETDLGGVLLDLAEDGGDPVREIRLPAIAEKKDPLGRKEGEALWPERYDEGALLHTKKVVGPYWFSAMYQGKPTPDEGGIFNRRDFRYFEISDELVTLHEPGGGKRTWGRDHLLKVEIVDLAASESELADYTVITEVWVTPEREMLVRRVVRDRIAGPDQPGFFRDHATGVAMKVEGVGAYGSHIVKTMLREGLPVEPVYPDADKVTRAAAAGVLYRQGRIYHLRGAEWLHDFEVELLAFPAGEHDDQVDTMSYAAKALPDLTVGRRPKRDKGKTTMGGMKTKRL